MNQRTLDCFVLYFIKGTSEIIEKMYQWLDCNIPSWEENLICGTDLVVFDFWRF